MIQPTSNYLGFNRTDAFASAANKAATTTPPFSGDSERLSSSNTEALHSALSNTPEVRPEVVERGHHLAVDPNYPPRELILRLAKLFTESSDPSDQA